jgi:predicted phage replisome organizer
MAEEEKDKRYYWLRLKRDFFKRHDIQIIESQPNGKDYVLFYLKLLVESVDHNGNLRFSDTIPYNEQMLSTITNTNIDIVRSAMKVFTGLGMIDVLSDQTIYMSEIENLIGSETYWASKKRLQRENELQIGQCPQNVPKMSNECPTCPSKSKSKSNINNIGQKPDQESELFNKFWTNYPRHVSKATAEKAFKKLKVTDTILEKMLGALETQKQSRQWSDKQYIPHPATWLNQKRWEDEADEPQGQAKLVNLGDGSFKLE